MLKRSTTNSSDVFREVLRQADEELHFQGKKAANFTHRGLRGNERAAALAAFLGERLPSIFMTGKGEAIDCFDGRTGELDLCIYDAATTAPILSAHENTLIPAEALYVVIEVKSTLTQAELNKCAQAALLVRNLRPFKKGFIAPPLNGESKAGSSRCLYIIFAYTTDLSEDNWAQKEFDRVKKATQAAGGTTDLIDRVVVLDRGMIRPQVGAATLRDESKGVFLECYISIINFMTRERRRRPLIDWENYRSRVKWVQLS